MLYKWIIQVFNENGEIQDFSENLVAPIFIEERLNDELDSGEIILENMTILTRNAFPPKTKIRLIKQSLVTGETIDYYDMLVDHDDVEEYPQCPELCTHRISIIEASAVAQGLHVDNIALTYELQDVTLNYKTTEPVEIEHEYDFVEAEYTETPTFESGGNFYDYLNQPIIIGAKTLNRRVCYSFEWVENDLNDVNNIIKDKEQIREGATVEIPIPKISCWVYGNNGWIRPLYLSTLTTIKGVKKNKNGEILDTFVNLSQEWHPTDFEWFDENVQNTFFKKVGDDIYQIGLNFFDSDKKSTYTNDEELIFYNKYDNSLGLAYPFPPRSQAGGHLSGAYPTDYAINDLKIWTNLAKLCTFKTGSNGTIKFTIPTLSLQDAEEGIYYDFEIKTEPLYLSGLVLDYSTTAEAKVTNASASLKISSTKNLSISSKQIYVKYPFRIGKAVEKKEQEIFKKPKVKYNAYDLLRKALLTTETKVLNDSSESLSNIKYSIKVDEIEWLGILKSTEIYETVIQGKNLWEVLLIIGKYIHAIPYLEFATNENKFLLKFKKLGVNTVSEDNSSKISIFNSRNLSEFFSQYDAYASNMFSPQNEIEETVVAKSDDGSYLIQNDNAVLILSKPIMELISVKMWYDNNEFDITDCIFEESVYRLLSVQSPLFVSPCKGDSLYFKYNTNKIDGLTYVRPSENNDAPSALKEILRKKAEESEVDIGDYKNVKFNNFLFKIKYKTQDALRISAFRPDLTEYMKNSSLERYPHHEQFFGQQEKIVDSERFSLNLFGELIRVGNSVYQRQEYAPIGSEKKSGELYLINSEPYYVTETHNEYYPDCVLQKVTYSKNFNQLAQIVTIPSEPRFYEIANQSLVTREIRLNDFFKLSVAGDETKDYGQPLFLGGNQEWSEILKKLLFDRKNKSESNVILPSYAYTRFLSSSTKFPFLIGQAEISNNNAIDKDLLEEREYASCIVPVLKYPIKNGIAFEWDMLDNFSAGDCVSKATKEGAEVDAYNLMSAVRYVDKYGRAEYFKFMLFSIDKNINQKQAQNLPLGTLFEENDSKNFAGTQEVLKNTRKFSIPLDKDNREILAFNYQINLLYDSASGFLTYPNLFGDKKSLYGKIEDTDTDLNIKIFALSTELEMFNSNVELNFEGDIIAEIDNDSFISDNELKFYLDKKINKETKEVEDFSEEEISNIQSILVCTNIQIHEDNNILYPLFGRNVSSLENSEKLKSWEIIPVYNKI